MGEEIDLIGIEPPICGKLLSRRTDLDEMRAIWNVNHGDDPPAKFVIVTLAPFGVIEFLKAHPLPIIGRPNLCDGSYHDETLEGLARTKKHSIIRAGD